MAYIIADNIISPLGSTSDENLDAVLSYKCALEQHKGLWNMPEPFVGGMLSEDLRRRLSINGGGSLFVGMVICSIREALSQCHVDIQSNRTLLIISTTKGEIDLVSTTTHDTSLFYPGATAKKIATLLNITTEPIVSCNACASGSSALLLAQRLIDDNEYDTVIVSGADCLSHFVVGCFQALKALSATPCRPFDIERTGLNLGEGVGTIILSKSKRDNHTWQITNGAIRNDAVHISNPSNKGIGLLAAIEATTQDIDITDLALINLHGTATMFNDQMEGVSIKKSGLADTAINALKGYYGHTMGACGIIETIINIHSIDKGFIAGTKGFKDIGVSAPLNISAEHRTTNRQSMLKTLSGFGGVNIVTHLTKRDRTARSRQKPTLHTAHTVSITTDTITVDGKTLDTKEKGMDMLIRTYKEHIGDYAKFYKMDGLSRLGFVATELLLNAEAEADGVSRFQENWDRAVLLFNNTSCIDQDIRFYQTIEDADNYFPSPATAVYCLPNVVTGEIAIRNMLHGETSFYILDKKNIQLIEQITDHGLDHTARSVIVGWIDFENNNKFSITIELKK